MAAAARNETGVHPDDREFVMSRTFDAPRDLVWRAWTDQKHLAGWWGPKGFTVKSLALDLRPGGTMLYCLGMPTGAEMWGLFRFREIVPQRKLVFINSFSNAKGEITRHFANEVWPLEMQTTVTFEENAGKTTVTVHWVPINATAEERKTFDDNRPSMTAGWTGTMDQLAAHLARA